ncbi:hypothetical protein CR513_03081, partial [Mucuna pruriens]
MWYFVGGEYLDKGLKTLIDDNGANKMINMVKMQRKVYLFALHPISQPNITNNMGNKPSMDEVDLVREMGLVWVDLVNVDGAGMENGLVVDGTIEVNVPDVKDAVEGSRRQKDNDPIHKDVNSDNHSKDQSYKKDNDSDSDYNLEHIFFDDFDEEIDRDDLFEVEEEVEIVAKNVKGSSLNKRLQPYIKGKRRKGRPRRSTLPTLTLTPTPHSKNLGAVLDNDSLFEEEKGLSDSEYYFEDLDNDVDSDEDKGKSGKFPIFNMPKKMTDYKWEVDAYFVDKKQFKESLLPMLCIQIKNDKKGMKVICKGGKGGCTWTIYYSKLSVKDTWQLRTIVDKNTCREFRTNVRENPKLKLNDIHEKTQNKWNIGITKVKAFRARNCAKNMVDGSFTEQYKRIYDYTYELLRSNLASILKMKVKLGQVDGDSPEHPSNCLLPTFQRLCRCKESFLKCSPIIGLDGYLLKGYYGGQILAAIGRDPND